MRTGVARSLRLGIAVLAPLITPACVNAQGQSAGKPVTIRKTDEERSIRKVLQGHWIGNGLTWHIDQDAFQANRDPKKPFDWKPLWISNITNRMILFHIGFDRYVGLLDEDDLTLSLTSNQFDGTYVLRKQPDPPELRRRQ